jgi:isopenicillin N synthase-like dioxygenase
MQILYYQPAVHTRELLQDPHDDSLYLTFSKADNPGLEILVSGGDYQPVILGRREMIVMPGEILSLMSGYRIAPLIHKVVRHSEQSERMTLGYFTLPNLEMGRQLRPWIVNESNKDVDIMQRVMRNQNKFIVQ